MFTAASIELGLLLTKRIEIYIGLYKQLRASESRKSQRTREEYCEIADRLVEQALLLEGGLPEVMDGTRRRSTFVKRMSALKYSAEVKFQGFLAAYSSRDNIPLLLSELEAKINLLESILFIARQGFQGQRLPRKSKQRALCGLPADWQERLCNRGSDGKYATALLVAALTGCRPSELVTGVRVLVTKMPFEPARQLTFTIIGAKVREGHGQPERVLSRPVSDDHPLTVMLAARLLREDGLSSTIDIKNAANFSAEVSRLARTLWPNHPSTVTAYVFRHQWSADAKQRGGDPDDVSRGMGHRSSKSRGAYAKRRQGRSKKGLDFVIKATFPIKQVAGYVKIPTHQPGGSDLPI